MKMKRVIIWLQNRGLAVKWFVSLSLISAVLFTALSYNNSREAESAFRKQFLTDTQQVNEKTNQLLDIYVDHIKTILLQLSTRSDLMQGGEEASKNLEKYREVNGSTLETIYLVAKDGRVVSNRQLYYDIVGNEQLTAWVKLAAANPYSVNWTEPYESKISGKTMAFVQTISDASNQIVGTAVVEINLLNLTNRLMPMLAGNDQTFTVISPENNIVTVDANSNLLPYEVYPRQITASFLQQVLKLPIGSSTMKGPKGQLIVVKSIASHLGWSLITFVDENYFYRNLHVLKSNYRNAAFFWFMILGVTSLLLIRYLVSPLRLLIVKMDRVNDLEVMSMLHVDRKDEIGKLHNSYYRMLERIRLLVSKVKEVEESKKEYEFKMLQSQIGPHFLYNTLACVTSLAKQQRLQEVEDTVRSLAGLLTFSFDRRSDFVTLAEEIEGLRMYAQIQSVRYGPRFTLHVDIPEQLVGLQVIKLSIQPLIENAIIHGIFPIKKPGHIYLRAKLTRDQLHIDVMDDGKGMSRERQRHILLDQPQSNFHKGFNSIGLLNVHKRIRVHCGEAYGLRIVSKENRGTVVRMCMPILKDQSDG